MVFAPNNQESTRIRYLERSGITVYRPYEVTCNVSVGRKFIYDVNVRTNECGNEELLRYNASVKIYEKQGDSLKIDVSKSRFYVNGRRPENMADCITIEAGEMIYPLLIDFNTISGGFEVLNYEQLWKRWINKKQDLLNVYDGDLIKRYLSQMEVTLSNKELFSIAIRRDLFLNNLFGFTPYGQYGFERKKRTILEAAQVIGFHSVFFECRLQLFETLTEKNLLKITYSGIPLQPIPSRTCHTLLGRNSEQEHKADSAEVRIEGYVLLNTREYMPEEIHRITTLKTGEFEKTRIFSAINTEKAESHILEKDKRTFSVLDI